MTARWRSAGLAAVLVAAAVLISIVTPDAQTRQQPFVATADQGETARSSVVQGRLWAVSAAREANGYGWTGETPGVWIVLDTELEAVGEPTGIYAELRIGDRAWDVATRPGSDALSESNLAPGLPMRGAILVEVPEDALAVLAQRGGELRVRTGFSERLAGVLVLRLDEVELEVEPMYELRPAERVG